MWMRIHEWLMQQEQRHTHFSTRYVLLAWCACIGQPLYYLMWTYLLPQAYDSLALRLLGVLVCLPALLARALLKGRWLTPYLFGAATFVLPFQFCFLYLMNHGSAVWSESLLVAVIVLFHFEMGWAVCSYAIGMLSAALLFALVGDVRFLISPTVLEQVPIHAFTIIVVSIVRISRRLLVQEKLAGVAQGLAAVAHELRTPLASVDANARGMHRQLVRGQANPKASGDAIGRIQFEVRHMNHLIDLFLLSASAVNTRLAPTEMLSMGDAIEAVLARYPFPSQAQRDKVRVELRHDFRFAGQQQLCVVVLLNLLRNALKAVHRAGKGQVRIRVDGDRDRPRLLFIDSGCGIGPGQLPHIFKRFYSYPPGASSGIGLALCKDIIEAWLATIRCVSRESAGTIFILEFPATACMPSPSNCAH
ncbi:MAG: HAMP domain-containing sensor histidine kinase [Pseudomonadota bacterium]